MKKTNIKSGRLSEAYSPSNFKTMGYKVIDLLSDYLEQVQTDTEYPVLPYHHPEEELAFWQDDFSSNSDILSVFKNVLNRSVHVAHPRYIGHQMASPALIATLAAPLIDILNNGSAVYEMGMVGNAIEKVVTDFLKDKIGFGDNASGFLTSGGTLANFTALLAARKAKAPTDIWKNGHEQKLAVIVSEEAHYSVERAIKILGLGDKGLIKIPVDENLCIQTQVLDTYLMKAKEDGLHVIAIIGSAATTSTGSYDNFEALSDFAKTHNIWLHIDGAHGGSVVFSDKYKYLAKGINKADSITIDFHKMLMTPAPSTALIFKNEKYSYDNFQQQAHYIWDSQESKEWYNSGKRTFECTKLMMSIKVYAILKTHGEKIFEENIDCLFDLTHSFAKLITKRDSFELALEPQSNIINFRYVKAKEATLDTLNSNIRQILVESGKFYIVQTMINGKRYLRCTVMNPLTKITDFEALLNEIESIAQQQK